MSLPRIALVAPEYPGCGPSYGVGAYLRTLATALADAGARPLVLVDSQVGRFVVEAGVAQRVGAAAPAGLLRPWLDAGWIDEQLQRHRIEVVEYPNWAGLGARMGSAVARVVRLSTPIALIPPRSLGQRLLRPMHGRWESLSVRRAQVVIADSAAMAEVGRRCYGRASDVVMPHAYDGQVADAPAGGGDIIAVGRLEERKGTDILLQAWASVRRRHPSVSLHLVGADANGFGARHLARVGGERVVVHGRIDDEALAAVRRRCGIEVIASRFESFGIVALEAWANGLAVVSSDAGALAEVVGGAGVVAPNGDPAALADAIHQVLADPGRRAELWRAGVAALRARHQPRDWAERTLAAYRDAIAKAAPGQSTSGR